MSDTERLEAELELSKLSDQLEAARERVHRKRVSDDDRKTYRELNVKVAEARAAFRTKYPPAQPAEGDATATPDTVKATGGVHRP